MTKYRATAEHCKGKSVDHPCSDGVYSDPANDLDVDIEADDEAAAEQIAWDMLIKEAESRGVCKCRRQLSPGSNAWVESVAITVQPIAS